MSLLGEIYGGSRINEEGNISINLEGMSATLWMFTNLFIWPISEGLYGQILGKRILKTKVISENGDPISMKQAFIRFFFLFIDVTPVGLIASALLNRRIGDWAAKTIVIDL